MRRQTPRRTAERRARSPAPDLRPFDATTESRMTTRGPQREAGRGVEAVPRAVPRYLPGVPTPRNARAEGRHADHGATDLLTRVVLPSTAIRSEESDAACDGSTRDPDGSC